MKRLGIFASFLLLNFGALALGGLFTGTGVTSEWYAELHKAPWTPPGWVFGAAWTSIMICYAFYIGVAWFRTKKRASLISYGLQWVLNVAWNPLFFYFHESAVALVVIVSLTAVLLTQLIVFNKKMRWTSVLLLPYIVWLGIATSLNLYIVLSN